MQVLQGTRCTVDVAFTSRQDMQVAGAMAMQVGTRQLCVALSAMVMWRDHQGEHAGPIILVQGRQRCCMALRAAITTTGSTGEQCSLTNLGLVDSTTIEVCCRAGLGRVRAERHPLGQCGQMHATVQQPGWRGGEGEQCTGTRSSAGTNVCQAARGAHAARVTISAAA